MGETDFAERMMTHPRAEAIVTARPDVRDELHARLAEAFGACLARGATLTHKVMIVTAVK